MFIRLADRYFIIRQKSNSNKRLFEMFSFGFATDNPHSLKLAQKNVSDRMDVKPSTKSVGYPGAVPVASLEQVYVKM